MQMVSYLAYVMRTHSEHAEKYLEGLELAALRILQDIPATALSPRRVSYLSIVWNDLYAYS